MKTKAVILSLLLTFASTMTVSAQTDTSAQTEAEELAEAKAYLAQAKKIRKVCDKIMFEIDLGVGLKQHDITPLSVGINLGYRIIPRLAIYARYSGTYGLYDAGEGRDYFKTTNLGGGAEYVLAMDKRKIATDMYSVRAQVSASVGSVDWKNTTYSIGLYSKTKYKNGECGPIIGIGFEHINSHTLGIRDCNTFFATIGFGM